MSNETPERSTVSLGDVIRRYAGMQCQYGSRYADPQHWGKRDYPNLLDGQYGDGRQLHVSGDSGDYHGMRIATEDALEFARRLVTYRREHGQMSQEYHDECLGRINDDAEADLVVLLAW